MENKGYVIGLVKHKKKPIGKGRLCYNCLKYTMRFEDEIAAPMCLYKCSKCGYEEGINT